MECMDSGHPMVASNSHHLLHARLRVLSPRSWRRRTVSREKEREGSLTELAKSYLKRGSTSVVWLKRDDDVMDERKERGRPSRRTQFCRLFCHTLAATATPARCEG